MAINAGDRRLAERPLGFAGAGVETGAQIVAAQGFRQRGLQAPGAVSYTHLDVYKRQG